MSTIDNLLTHSPARYGQQAGSDRLWIYERNRRFHLLAWDDDVDCVMGEIGEQLVAAIRHGSPELVGRVVMAAVNANLDRLAAKDVGMDLQGFHVPEDAVKSALSQYAAERERWAEFATLRAEYAKQKASADANEWRKGS